MDQKRPPVDQLELSRRYVERYELSAIKREIDKVIDELCNRAIQRSDIIDRLERIKGWVVDLMPGHGG